MRNLELLISQSRRNTENTDFSDTTGISNADFIDWANQGQERLQSLLTAVSSDLFEAEKEVQMVSGQEGYDIPDDAYLKNRLVFLEFTETGNARDYFALKKGRLRERVNGIPSTPSVYIRRGSQILLQPTPDSSAGKLRITYQKRLPRLDIRQAKVASVSTSGSSITSLTLSTSELLTSDSREALLEEGYFSVIDKDGIVKMKKVPVLDIDLTTGVVTLDTFSFESGETIAANNYLVRGPFTTTHSQLPDTCERYLVAYMDWKALKKDSNTDSGEQTVELQTIEKDIVESFAEPDADVNYVPIIDASYLDLDIE